MEVGSQGKKWGKKMEQFDDLKTIESQLGNSQSQLIFSRDKNNINNFCNFKTEPAGNCYTIKFLV